MHHRVTGAITCLSLAIHSVGPWSLPQLFHHVLHFFDFNPAPVICNGLPLEMTEFCSNLSSSDRRFVVYWASALLPDIPVLKRNCVPSPSPDAVDQSPSKIIKLLGERASLQ